MKRTSVKKGARLFFIALNVSFFSLIGSIVMAAFIFPNEPAPQSNISSPLNQLTFFQEKAGTIGATRFEGLFPGRYFDPSGMSKIEGVLDEGAPEPGRVVSINASDSHITNVASPTENQDAANKAYVDLILGP